MNYNKEMSEKYGLHIYNSENEQFPYFVQEWDECFTEDEIIYNKKDADMIEGIQMEDDGFDREEDAKMRPWDYGK